MPQCSLTIRLDRQDAFRAGDEISGQVIVEADEPCACRRLAVRPVLEVRSQNGTQARKGAAIDLFDGQWPAGETAYPFRFAAPAGPFEHLGQHLSISWIVEASADVPWAKDLRTETHIKLEAPEELEREIKADNPTSESDPQEKKDSSFAAYAVYGALLLACIGATGYGIYTGEVGGIVGGLVGIGVVSLIIYAVRLSDEDESAARKIDRVIGRPRLIVEQRRRGGYREGEEASVLDCALHVKSSAPTLAVRAALTVEERVVVTRGGEHRRSETFSDILHAANCELVAKDPGVYRGSLPLPTSGQVPCSLGSSRDGIFWAVEATVSQAGKTWSRSARTKLRVSPAGC